MTRSQRRAENRQFQAERERVAEIIEIGKVLNEQEIAAEFAATGRSVEELKKAILAKHSTKPLPTANIGLPGWNRDRYSFGAPSEFSLHRLVRAQLTSDWSQAGYEREISQELQRQAGKTPQGNFIPLGALQTRAAISVGGSGGSLRPTEHLGNEFIDVLRARSMVLAMGARVMSGLHGDAYIPRKTASGTAGWVAEGADAPEAAATFDGLTMQPKSISAYADATRKMILQSNPDIEYLIREDLAAGIATAIDVAAINGSGSGAVPRGILNTPGIGDVAIGANGGAPTWDHIVDLIGAVADANADVGQLAFLTNSKVRSKLMKTQKFSGTNGMPVWEWSDNAEGRMAGFRAGASNNVPGNLTKGTGTNLSALIFGNWNDLLIGMWGAVDVLVDPYALSKSGGVRIVAFSDCDISVRHAASFAAIKDAAT